MRLGPALLLTATLATGACSSGTASPTAPSPSATLAGPWTGSTSDSSGSMMGAGATAAMMNNTQWTITQTGDTFSGTMQLPGYAGMMQSTMTVRGTMTGRSGVFTMTMPAGSMMMAGCSATATGAFDMDDAMNQFHGTYSGTNSCTGAFDHGQVSMHR